jgi:hypothetical protein
MAKGFLGSVLVLVSCVSPAFASTKVAVAMTGDCPIPNDVIAFAKRESTRIWSAAGVTLRWMNPADLPYESSPSDWLVVRCVAAEQTMLQPKTVRALPIAAIRFVGGTPTNTIVVSIDNAKTLLARDASESRNMSDRFALLRELRLGRMLGRAIAHEIGHFLNQSQDHTPSGLMRASHTLANLIGQSSAQFKVDRLPVRSADAGPVADLERQTSTPTIR